MEPVCCIKGCEKPSFVGDCCKGHWERWKKYGSPLRYKVRQYHGLSEQDRFWKWVEKTDECWIWVGSLNTTGYGQLTVKRQGSKRSLMLSHRASWEYANGPIPSDMYVCHRCDTPACVRPDHLFLGSQLENMKDMMRKGRGNPGGELKGRHHNHKRKLTEDQVREILSSREPDGVLAVKYGVRPQTISSIQRREIWKHIKE